MGTILRILFILCLLFMTSGCAVWTYFTQCDTCALTTDDTVESADGMGILAVGLTVIHDDAGETDQGGDDIDGSIGWFGDTLSVPSSDTDADGDHPPSLSDTTTMVDLKFPDGMTAGEHRLVLWRVPPGRWALRHGRLGSGSDSRLSRIFSPWALTTRVTAGQITYAGEIRITAKSRSPLLEIAHDPAFARQALSAYDKIGLPLIDSPLNDLHREKPRGH